MDIYYEPQSGGLCRKHSINAFYGMSEISTEEFYKYCTEFDKYIKDIYDEDIDTLSNDIITSNHLNVITYILMKRSDIYSVYIAPFTLQNFIKERNINSLDDIVRSTDFIFVLNYGHVWGIRKKNNKWYTIDSLSGVHYFSDSLSNLDSTKGYILIRSKKDLVYDIDCNKKIITTYLQNNGVNFRKKTCLINFLKKLNREKKLLDNLEVPLATSYYYIDGLLKTSCLLNKIDDDCKKIKKMVGYYKKFHWTWEREKLNIDNTIKYVPYLIIKLLLFSVKI